MRNLDFSVEKLWAWLVWSVDWREVADPTQDPKVCGVLGGTGAQLGSCRWRVAKTHWIPHDQMLVGEEDAGLRITPRLDGWWYQMLGAQEFVGKAVKFFVEMSRVRFPWDIQV